MSIVIIGQVGNGKTSFFNLIKNPVTTNEIMRKSYFRALDPFVKLNFPSFEELEEEISQLIKDMSKQCNLQTDQDKMNQMKSQAYWRKKFVNRSLTKKNLSGADYTQLDQQKCEFQKKLKEQHLKKQLDIYFIAQLISWITLQIYYENYFN
ncbi:unnamed protein product [Paramecium pentaurelia]|uniref:Uncharacterized protein n=1 Tax=Paramecium pentaurelia TaxID=43138 RepID=A0A8S1V6Y2_9CILI|nr:unnamed protein product [Paramecium pentaurelia]